MAQWALPGPPLRPGDIVALPCVTIPRWLPFILPTHSSVNSSFTELLQPTLLARAIGFCRDPTQSARFIDTNLEEDPASGLRVTFLGSGVGQW